MAAPIAPSTPQLSDTAPARPNRIDFASVIERVPAGGRDLHTGDRIFGMARTHGRSVGRVSNQDPVRCTDLAEYVNRLAAFVSHDDWQFEFVRLRYITSHRPHRNSTSNTRISLFSGGLDSLCGAHKTKGSGAIDCGSLGQSLPGDGSPRDN